MSGMTSNIGRLDLSLSSLLYRSDGCNSVDIRSSSEDESNNDKLVLDVEKTDGIWTLALPKELEGAERKSFDWK